MNDYVRNSCNYNTKYHINIWGVGWDEKFNCHRKYISLPMTMQGNIENLKLRSVLKEKYYIVPDSQNKEYKKHD